MSNEVTHKKCGKCKEFKTLDCFYNMKVGTHGKDGYCKDCRKQKNQEYEKKNRQRRNDYWRNYYAIVNGKIVPVDKG